MSGLESYTEPDWTQVAWGAHDEEATLSLFQRLRGPKESLRSGDVTALRDHLVLAHAPLVEHCARNFLASGEPLEDLVQEGYVGLLKAVDRFDPGKGIKFSTYACHLIAGEIRHYLRDLGRLIHEPGWHFELRQRIARTSDQLSQQLGHPPTPEAIASALNVKVETVRDVLKNAQVLTVDSLDSKDQGSGEESQLSVLERHDAARGGPVQETPGGVERRIEDRMFIEEALPQLKDLEQQAIRLFFFEDLSKSDIARRLGLSVNYVAYLIKRGTENMRRIMDGPQTVPGGVLPVGTLGDFLDWAEEEKQGASRDNSEFSVLWLQLAGWQSGTASARAESRRGTLNQLDEIVRRTCRGKDKVARLPEELADGLHFLVLLCGTGAPGLILADRLRTQFEQHPPLQSGALLLPHVAYATYPGDGMEIEALLSVLKLRLGLAGPAPIP